MFNDAIPEIDDVASTAVMEAVDKGATFPTDTLASPVKAFVEETAQSLSVAADLVALPALVTLGAAIGNARRIRLKDDWEESAALYGAVVADTGSMKSPALQKATAPIVAAQTDERRTWVGDTTVEALGPILKQHQRGLLMIRDELVGWVKALNQYRGGNGSDREFYLQAWSGASHAVDRVTGASVYVERPFLGVIGCLPPDRLVELEDKQGHEDGFIQRLLFVWPASRKVRWSDRAVPHAVIRAYHALVKELMALDWQGPDPLPLSLTPEALKTFIKWHDHHCEEMEAITLPALRGFYSKLKGYGGRLALVHALSSNPATTEIGLESVQAAASQIEYFKAQAGFVAERVCRSVGSRGQRLDQCKNEIRRAIRKHGSAKKRELQKNSNHPGVVFNAAWNSMITPELLERSDGKFMISKYHDTDIPTFPFAKQGVVPSTDIPTTDIPVLAVGRG